MSLVLHLLLLLLASLLLKGCQQGSPGTAGGEAFREVGLFVVDGSEDGRGDVGLQPVDGSDDHTQPAPQCSAATKTAADQTAAAADNPAGRV
ncbi:MAG: hypothetical protein ACK5DM_11905, partial [Planctomyces sp.]